MGPVEVGVGETYRCCSPEVATRGQQVWDEALTLSIVVPAFNEAPRLAERAGRLNDAANEGIIDPRSTQLIVVDDGSTDDTARIAELLLGPVFPRLRVLRLLTNSGKGAAVRAGAAAADAPVVAFMDADMSVDPSQIPRLLAAMEEADVVIGSRSLADSTVDTKNGHRVVMGRTFNFFVNAMTNVGFKDTQCGFKAFRTPVARILFHLMMVDRFAFDVELLTLARQLGLQVTEVPVQWTDADNSTVRPLADSMSMALDVFRMHWRRDRPSIPALVVGAHDMSQDLDRAQTLADAFGVFRKTDPIFPLPEDRALILLPLCRSDEINGAAFRLGGSSSNLMVDRRLVSCAELMEMKPLATMKAAVPAGVAADPHTSQRLTLLSNHDVRSYKCVGSESISRLEV
jgi:dolichyl-phosphate beta-glucosyltransferase